MDNAHNIRKNVLSILNELEQEPSLATISNFSEELEQFRNRLRDDVFRIAVVGMFSSGKSTFINALLGKDILSHATKETTAVLTRIVNVPAEDKRNGTGLAIMRDGTQQPIDDLKTLEDYTTAVSKKFSVAEEIAAVEIYIPLMHAQRPVMLIDTPGLDGTAEGHLEQTIKIVQEAHACIYLIQSRGFTKEDVSFLQDHLAPYQQHFIFVQNFIDEFKTWEGETVEGRLSSLRQLLQEKIFPDTMEYFYQVCGVSALRELVARDETIRYLYQDDTEEVKDADRRKLRETSGFDKFRQTMEEMFGESQLDDIQYGSTAVAVRHWMESLLKIVARRSDEAQELYQASSEAFMVEKLERLQQRILGNQENHKSALQGFIAGESKEIQKKAKEMLEQGSKNIEEMIADLLSQCKNDKDMEAERKRMPSNVKNQLDVKQHEVFRICHLLFQSLYQSIMERIEEYTDINRSKIKIDLLQPEQLPTSEREFKEEIRYGEQQKERLLKKENELRDVQHANAAMRSQVENLSQAVQYWRSAEKDTRNEIGLIQKALRQMGARPAARVWTETVSRSGFWGTIKDFFCGKQTKPMTDDSAGQAWDRERKRLQRQQNAYANKLDDLNREKQAKERECNSCYKNERETDAKIKALECEIEQLKGQITTEKEKIETQKRKAMSKYMEQCRNILKKQLHRYLYGESEDAPGVIQKLEEEWNGRIDEGKENLKTKAIEMYEDSVQQKLVWIAQAKQEKSPQLQKAVHDLTSAKSRLEICLEKINERVG